MRLTPGQVHLWLVFPRAIRNREPLLRAYRRLMSASERVAHERFLFEKDRHTHLVTRALVRTTLSAYAPEVPPADWRFETNEYGRPAIAAPTEHRGLLFNLSHTAGLIACAVARDREVGVDVEVVDPRRSTMEIAASVFAPTELRELRELTGRAHLERFYALWTLKESYIKARGMGLAIPLDAFRFDLCGAEPRIFIQPSLGDEADSWQFMQRRPSDEHRLALAIRRGVDPELVVVERTVVPCD